MKNYIRATRLTVVFVAALSLLSVFAEAQTGKTKTVRFVRGKSSIVLKGAVVRGTSDRYVVTAKKGQTMSVKITSLEKNANFTVYIKSYFEGELESLAGSDEAIVWTDELGEDNDYIIVVATSRGNANYTLTVAVK